MEVTPLAALSLTQVYYNPNDLLSYLCAWLALVPQTLCIIYGTLLWSSREIEVLLMFTGQLGCEAVNFGLKRLIKEERPIQMNGKGYGMPSSHAQFVGYFAVASSLFLLFRHQPPAERTKMQEGTGREGYGETTVLLYWQRVLLSVYIWGVCATVALSRIYLSYHTPTQVLVGFGAGASCGFIWFAVTQWLRRHGWVDWILNTSLARLGRWRDLIVEEDLAESGWRRWMEVQKIRTLKAADRNIEKKVR